MGCLSWRAYFWQVCWWFFLRRKIRRKAEDLRDEALDHYEHFRDGALEHYEKISGKVKQGAEKAVADVKESYEDYKKNSQSPKDTEI